MEERSLRNQRIGIVVNGIDYQFRKKKDLPIEEDSCSECILNYKFCEGICFRVEEEMERRRK